MHIIACHLGMRYVDSNSLVQPHPLAFKCKTNEPARAEDSTSIHLSLTAVGMFSYVHITPDSTSSVCLSTYASGFTTNSYAAYSLPT